MTAYARAGVPRGVAVPGVLCADMLWVEMSELTRPIAICSMVLNEAPCIAEWIAYHLVIGVDSIVIYDDMSTDDTREIVAKMSVVGDVRRIDLAPHDARMQTEVFSEGLECFGDEFEWMLFLDADEFVFPVANSSVREVMAGFAPGVSAVGLNWTMYGSSGLERRPEGQLVTETFLRHAAPTFPQNRTLKWAVRPHRVIRCIGVHLFEVVGQSVSVDGTDISHPPSGSIPFDPSPHAPMQLNHYFTKSRAEWEVKKARGYRSSGIPNRTENEFRHYDRNELYDDRILQYAEATRGLMAAAGVLTG